MPAKLSNLAANIALEDPRVSGAGEYSGVFFLDHARGPDGGGANAP